MALNFTAERAKLAALHTVTGRAPAKAAGLQVFNGYVCPVRGHGRVRRLSDSRCVDCLEEADRIKAEAQQAGRAAALKKARAEVTRELKAAEKAKAREAAEALKAQQMADRQKAARGATRAKRKAERLAAAAPAAPQPVPYTGHGLDSPPWDTLDSDDDSPPWD
jgi:hypothetical protein